MTFPASLPAALAEHAASRPEEPWFFVRAGWDWAWAPWREVAAQAERWAERVAGVPSGTRIGFADRPWPRALVIDLGIQAAGLVSVPLQGAASELSGLAGEHGCGAWIGAQDEVLAVEPAPEAGDAGGALVISPAGPVVLSQADLLAAATAIQDLLPAGRGREREIVVTGGRLEDPSIRRLLSWVLLSGAALVLEEDAWTAVATAAWARPTVFQGDARELAALRRAVEETSGRSRRRLPFGRLHTLLVAGEEELTSADCSFWNERRVHLARLPRVV